MRYMIRLLQQVKTFVMSKHFEDMPKKRGNPEAKVQAAVIKFLRTIEDGQFYLTNVVASATDAGMPDITGHINGWYVAVECKEPNGGVQSKKQKDFQKKCESLGGKYIIAKSVKDVKTALLLK